jgi:hypothetical protein
MSIAARQCASASRQYAFASRLKPLAARRSPFPLGLKVDGVSYTKEQASNPGWTIVF